MELRKGNDSRNAFFRLSFWGGLSYGCFRRKKGCLKTVLRVISLFCIQYVCGSKRIGAYQSVLSSVRKRNAPLYFAALLFYQHMGYLSAFCSFIVQQCCIYKRYLKKSWIDLDMSDVK